MKKIKYFAGIFVVCYAIYSVKSVIDNSNASVVQQCIAGLALLIWFGWTVYTIGEKSRNRENGSLRFEYSRTTDGFPDEFDDFCKRHHIGATEAFVRDAVRKEMGRIDREEKGRD